MSHFGIGLPMVTAARQSRWEGLGNQSCFQTLAAIGPWERYNYSPLVLCESADGVWRPGAVCLAFFPHRNILVYAPSFQKTRVRPGSACLPISPAGQVNIRVQRRQFPIWNL